MPWPFIWLRKTPSSLLNQCAHSIFLFLARGGIPHGSVRWLPGHRFFEIYIYRVPSVTQLYPIPPQHWFLTFILCIAGTGWGCEITPWCRTLHLHIVVWQDLIRSGALFSTIWASRFHSTNWTLYLFISVCLRCLLMGPANVGHPLVTIPHHYLRTMFPVSIPSRVVLMRSEWYVNFDPKQSCDKDPIAVSAALIFVPCAGTALLSSPQRDLPIVAFPLTTKNAHFVRVTPISSASEGDHPFVLSSSILAALCPVPFLYG